MKRVLHVEHRREVAEWVGLILAEEGFSVITVGSAEAAIHQLTAGEFDLTLLSLHLPVKPADRVIEWIAANRRYMIGRLLVVSETALSPGQEAFLESLEIPQLLAPFTGGELVQCAKAVLARPMEEEIPRRRSWTRRHALAS